MKERNACPFLPFLLLLAVLWHSRLCPDSLPVRELTLVETPVLAATKEITS